MPNKNKTKPVAQTRKVMVTLPLDVHLRLVIFAQQRDLTYPNAIAAHLAETLPKFQKVA